jgi:hypothetical protein
MQTCADIERAWQNEQYVECDSIIISLRSKGSGSSSDNKDSNSGNGQSHSNFKDELA